jgi:hypothetical protein
VVPAASLNFTRQRTLILRYSSNTYLTPVKCKVEHVLSFLYVMIDTHMLGEMDKNNPDLFLNLGGVPNTREPNQVVGRAGAGFQPLSAHLPVCSALSRLQQVLRAKG